MRGHDCAPITLVSLLRLRLRSARSRASIGAAVATIISTLACGETASLPTGASNPSARTGGGAVNKAAAAAYSTMPVPFAGRLLDYTTGAALSNATVTLYTAGEPSTSPFTTTTNASGAFTLTVPRGWYAAAVNGRPTGGPVRATVGGTRGDLFVNGGNCDARYGVVTDMYTDRPIKGASVSGILTGDDGWYHWTDGCPPAQLNFGTRAISVSQPDYQFLTVIIGLGRLGLSRRDMALTPRTP